METAIWTNFPTSALSIVKADDRGRDVLGTTVTLIKIAFKNQVREELGDVFGQWDAGQTHLFNRGVDKALSGIQWVVYPKTNVTYQAGEGDWVVWLRAECEERGMVEVKAGRQVIGEF